MDTPPGEVAEGKRREIPKTRGENLWKTERKLRPRFDRVGLKLDRMVLVVFPWQWYTEREQRKPAAHALLEAPQTEPCPGKGMRALPRNKEGVIVRNRQVEQLVRLTQACLTRYWQLDCEYVPQYLDRDVIWIGSAAHQFVEGREAAAADLRRSMEEIQSCHLPHQAFLVAQNAGNACTIVGRYLTTTDDEVGYCLQAQQRCTVTWELGEAGPKIKCLHVSNPMGELKLAEGETFVNVLGQTTRKYIQDRLQGWRARTASPWWRKGGTPASCGLGRLSR